MTDCVLTWLADNGAGYARIMINGKRILHHRYVYHRHNNISLEDMEGKLVLHTCDNSRCINPAHLYLGTHEDNMRDMVARNRVRTGKQLTQEIANDIRARRYKATGKELAAEYGVEVDTIYDVWTGKTWKENAPVANYNAKLTDDQVKYIRSNRTLYARELAAMFNVSIGCIYSVQQGKTYKHVI